MRDELEKVLPDNEGEIQAILEHFETVRAERHWHPMSLFEHARSVTRATVYTKGTDARGRRIYKEALNRLEKRIYETWRTV